MRGGESPVYASIHLWNVLKREKLIRGTFSSVLALIFGIPVSLLFSVLCQVRHFSIVLFLACIHHQTPSI